jgi:hypothetical protein
MKKLVKSSYDKGIDIDLYKKVARYICSEDEDLQRIGINMYYGAPLVNKYHENYFDFSPREGIKVQRQVTIARMNVDVRRRNIPHGIIIKIYKDEVAFSAPIGYKVI